MSEEVLYREESEFYRVRLVRTESVLPEGMLPRTAVRHSVFVEDRAAPVEDYVHECRRKDEARAFFLAEVGRLRRKYGLPGEES